MHNLKNPLKIDDLDTAISPFEEGEYVSAEVAQGLLDVCNEVIKIWNEDGDNGEIQMKTPIAWHRAVNKAEEAIKKATE